MQRVKLPSAAAPTPPLLEHRFHARSLIGRQVSKQLLNLGVGPENGGGVVTSVYRLLDDPQLPQTRLQSKTGCIGDRAAGERERGGR